MEFLKAFANHNEYSAFTGTDKFVRPNVSYCITENENHYNPIKPKLFDYIYSDGTYSPSFQEGKTCVGIVVIPAGHIDDMCRVMSVHDMAELNFTRTGNDTYTVSENTGTTTATSLIWSTNYFLINESSLKVINIYPDNSLKGYKNGTNYLTKYDGTVEYIVNGYNENQPYMWNYDNVAASGSPTPSPFLSITEGNSIKNAAKNPMYTYGSTSDNALVNIGNGTELTNSIISYYATGVSAYTNDGVMVAQTCEAASSCRAYNPKGTGFHVGEWYLPTIGELGYVYFNLSEINSRLINVGTVVSSSYRSSSESSNTAVWCIDFSSGAMSTYYKDRYTFYCRAFLAL